MTLPDSPFRPSAAIAWAMLSRFPPPLYPVGFIEPCLPTLGHRPPDGAQWAYEIKHDGFRFISGRDGERALGIRLSDHLDGDGQTIFRHACALGAEGIVAKRRDRPYRSGRCADWVKVRNPVAPAATREFER